MSTNAVNLVPVHVGLANSPKYYKWPSFSSSTTIAALKAEVLAKFTGEQQPGPDPAHPEYVQQVGGTTAIPTTATLQGYRGKCLIFEVDGSISTRIFVHLG